MQIAYFVANKTESQVDLEFVNSIGLGYAFDSKPACRPVESGRGIEGNSGVTFARDASSAFYLPESQEWQPLAGVDGVWVGINRDKPPTPREMVRSDWLNSGFDDEISIDPPLLVIDSHDLEAGGYSWPIPIARAWSITQDGIGWFDRLPRSVEYVCEGGEKGFKPGAVIKKFFRLEQIAETIQTCWHDSEVPDNYLMLSSEVLSIPYYIGPQEMAMMGLVDSRPATVANLLWLVIDNPGFREMVKKKAEQESQSNESGSGG